MTNEKSNSWKAKLEDANELREYSLQNKNAAWESLYDKLHEKSKPKRLWYWMAAACVIAVITIVSIRHHSVNDNIAIHRSVKSKPQRNPVAKQSDQQSANKKIIVTHDVVKTKTINTNIDKAIKQTISKNEIAITDNSVLKHEELTNTKIELPVLKDSMAQTTISVLSAPKKMKVVHVNELDDDGSNINMAQNRIPSRIKFLNQDIYTDYTLSVPTSGINILKNKNSTSN